MFDVGHITKMAASPIYGKNPTKPIINCSNDYPVLTMTYFMARSYFITKAFLLGNVETMDYSETIAVCDLNIGRCRQLDE